MTTIPLPGETFTFSIPLVDQADSHVFKVAPTIAAGDFQRSINNGAFANMDNLPAVTPTGGRLLQIVVSAAETTAAGDGGTIDIIGSDAAGAEWDDIDISLRVGPPSANVTLWKGEAPADINAVGSVVVDVQAWLGQGVPAMVDANKLPAYIEELSGLTELTGYPQYRRFVEKALEEAPVTTALTAQEIADAGLLAPTPGSPATGSVYDLLTAMSSEPAQLDWDAWTTPDGALKTLYDDNCIDVATGLPSDYAATDGAAYFGSYVMCEFDGSLFIGVSNTPLNGTGAIIVRLDTPGGTPVFEYNLPEEGVQCMTVGVDGNLYVTGADERLNTGDSSIYIRTSAGVWTRKQTLTDMQHVLGLTFDIGGRLWISGQGNPQGAKYSIDYGDTWTSGGIGSSYRIYDVIHLSTALIMTAWDPLPFWPVYRSTNVGVSWNQVTGIESGKSHMVEWSGVIVGLQNTGDLFTVDSSGTGLSYTLPFTAVQQYNSLIVDTDGYLCVLGTTGVWRTNDLANWKQVWSFSPADTVRSLGTWGDDLVVSTSGASAAILSRPASPEAAQQQMTTDAVLDDVIEGTFTLRQMMKIVAAAVAGVSSGGGTSAVTFTGLDGSTPRIVATVDASGNRSAVTKTVT